MLYHVEKGKRKRVINIEKHVSKHRLNARILVRAIPADTAEVSMVRAKLHSVAFRENFNTFSKRGWK